jgi:PTH1 family peptidyl-tRNA hydrolase
MKIIFAQGNPEPDYAKSRHNVGFTVLNTIANQYKIKWSNRPKFQALTTEIIDNSNQKILLVKPTTYYNDTGDSVQKLVNFYKIDPANDLLVVHDDFALPFGAVRVRQQGSDAGNNGIKSINAVIGQTYTRIRIGTWNNLREQIDDSDFVLGKFSSEEDNQLQKIILPKAIELIEQFCNEQIKPTSYKLL